MGTRWVRPLVAIALLLGCSGRDGARLLAIGDHVTTDGWTITAQSPPRAFEPPRTGTSDPTSGAIDPPPVGQRYVAVLWELHNDRQKTRSTPNVCLGLVDAAGSVHRGERLITAHTLTPDFFEVEPGATLSMTVVYGVPADATGWSYTIDC